MKSILAIAAGGLFIFIASLLMQLAYVLIAVEYNTLAKSISVLNEIRDVFRYLVGIPIHILIMFLGGYLTADIANSRARVVLHCFLVGFITFGGMLWMASANSELTLGGIVLLFIAIAATVAGGLYWQRKEKTASTSCPENSGA